MVKQAQFRFYSSLNDFLPMKKRRASFSYAFNGSQTVKHLIESAGVPHTEVDLILVNGEPAPFSQVVQDGDRVSVYPTFESIDIAAVSRVRPAPLKPVRFVADTHLGRLAAYLRMLGFDTLYRTDYRDEELAEVAGREERVVLTRDRWLLMRNAVMRGYYVREKNARAQLLEVVRRFDLADAASPFERCLRCNEPLEPAARNEVIDRVPPRSREHYDEFWRCRGCQRVYWGGSHYRRMERLIQQVLYAARGGPGYPRR